VLASLAAGLGLGLSLIVAIGAQNLFVLRQGLRRESVALVAAICTVSDAALIALGVSGVGLALQAAPWLVSVVRWAGAAFLVAYGVLAAVRALRPRGEALRADEPSARPDSDTPAAGGSGPARRGTAVRTAPWVGVALTCLALTWLNPHVYLDTVFLLGSVASAQGDGRWWFALGAAVASALWFFGLAFGARYLGRWLASPRAWRILDVIVAVVMVGIGVSLVLP
jgi:L-lysine exporter family protein LysE/ArgO